MIIKTEEWIGEASAAGIKILKDLYQSLWPAPIAISSIDKKIGV